MEKVSKRRLRLVYLSGFLMAVHFASVSYVNSSLLSQFVGENVINLLYIIGSLLSLTFLFSAPLILRRHGSIFTFLLFILLEIFAVFGLGTTGNALFIIPLFILHLGADSALYFCLDLNLEQETKAEGTTGRKRGFLLAASNIAWILSPLALVFLIKESDFSNIYFLSGAALIPLFLMVQRFFKNTERPTIATSSIASSFLSLLRGGDKARIIMVQFMLNFFYAWMVIYLPLLLSKEIGFGWDKIGLIFTIMLLPFLLLELPAGIISDKKIGEKELLIAGFIIMFLATSAIPFLGAPLFWAWALILFATRVGASLVEVSSESYFFKHVKEEDTGLISLFRMARPLSFVIAPIFALPVIHFFSYSISFYFLSLFVLLGLFFIPKIDTK